MVDLREKLRKYREEKNLTQEEMADLLGIKYRTYQNIEGSGQVKKIAEMNKINAIFGVYTNLDESGEEAEQHQVGEGKEEYWKERQLKKLNNKAETFPVFAGNTQLKVNEDLEVYADDPQVNIPIGHLSTQVFPGCNYAEKAFGNSMYPRIVNQGIAAGKLLSKEKIVYGELYGLHLTGGSPPVIKYIKKSKEAGYLTLKSENPHVEDQDILFDDITLIFRVLYIINPA